MRTYSGMNCRMREIMQDLEHCERFLKRANESINRLETSNAQLMIRYAWEELEGALNQFDNLNFES
jgi:hypothetical protein